MQSLKQKIASEAESRLHLGFSSPLLLCCVLQTRCLYLCCHNVENIFIRWKKASELNKTVFIHWCRFNFKIKLIEPSLFPLSWAYGITLPVGLLFCMSLHSRPNIRTSTDSSTRQFVNESKYAHKNSFCPQHKFYYSEKYWLVPFEDFLAVMRWSRKLGVEARL